MGGNNVAVGLSEERGRGPVDDIERPESKDAADTTDGPVGDVGGLCVDGAPLLSPVRGP
jgi:hypothetical protein